MSRSRVALIVLFFAALLVPVSPAHASYTVVCSGYTSCTNQGYSHFGYASAQGKSYWNMYTGTNCTNYVAYRLVTTNGMANQRPKSGVGNARDWGKAMASITDATPVVGSVAWWGKTGNHVAYIEKVVSSNEIWVSESNWSGAFDWRKITRSGGSWPDGFIHFTSPALDNTSPPVVAGTVKVGSTVKASVGAWTPTPSSYAYQWLVDGKAVSGAMAKSFTPTSSILGKKLSATVTARRSGYPASTLTSKAITVALGTLSGTALPVVTGNPQVGSTLSTSTGTWSRSDLTFTHQWMSGGVPVPGATGPTYAVRSSDVGKPVTARVTAQRVGYVTAGLTSAATADVVPGVLVRRSAPSISGTARVGSRLTASPGTWTPSPDFGYQWFADGQAVSGATGSTFLPSHRERDKAIRVQVTATRPGYTTMTATSASTTPLASGHITVTKVPVIKGSALLGSKVTIDAGTYSPGDAVLRYEWLRDGVVIPGVTGRTRTVTAGDLGHRLSGRVTYKATGFSARTVTTATTTRARTTPKLSIAATSPSVGKVVFTIKVSAPRVSAPSGTITVRYASGKVRTLPVSRGRATLTLGGQGSGARTYRFTFGATSTVAAASRDKVVSIR